MVDFGLPNATMHKLDEAAAVEDIRALQRIYARVIKAALAAFFRLRTIYSAPAPPWRGWALRTAAMSAAWREAASQSPTAARIAPRFSAARHAAACR